MRVTLAKITQLLIILTVIVLIAYASVSFVSCCITGASRWSNETILLFGLAPSKVLPACVALIAAGIAIKWFLNRNNNLPK